MSNLLRTISRHLDSSPAPSAKPSGSPKALRPGFRNSTVSKRRAQISMLAQAFEAGHRAALSTVAKPKPSLFQRLAARVRGAFKGR